MKHLLKPILLLFLVVATLSACTQKKESVPAFPSSIELTYRGIPVGKDISEINLDSLLAERHVIENKELLSHLEGIGLEGKELVAQFIDSIVVNDKVILRGYVLVYAFNNIISDIVFNTQQASKFYYPDIVKLYERKYGNSKEEYTPFSDSYFDSRGNKWEFYNNTIHIYSFMYHPGKSREYIDMSMLSTLERTEIIYRDNKTHQEVLDKINARMKHDEDSIQHIKDSLNNVYKSIMDQQDI